MGRCTAGLHILTASQAKDSARLRFIRGRDGLRFRIVGLLDKASGWIAAALIGTLTAGVAFLVDIAQATVSDWKLGYCSSNPLLSRQSCCKGRTPLMTAADLGSELGEVCDGFRLWSGTYTSSFAIYVAFALLFGVVASGVTMLTKTALPTSAQAPSGKSTPNGSTPMAGGAGKVMYMAAGSGIPEIKTILSGFVIPGFLELKVLIVKALGAVFAVSTGMCLGKEGPFVHISTCVGYIVASLFPKYRHNGRKMREMLSAACASGLSVAFGAPIGGVLFSYEEISTYFPRKVLLRAFLCSLCAAVVLKALNPTGTGKLVLFETNYGTSYEPEHYLVFVILGVAGGVFGGVFCKLNFMWSKWFRSFWFIKGYPVFEVLLIVLATTLLQFPNPLIRETGDEVVKNLFVDCKDGPEEPSWLCNMESKQDRALKGWLVYGVLTKLVLTIITFGVKVPSGVIIPALDGGALFGRLIGQWITNISPGIFAMVGAAAFLAGVSRMTISLAVIMFELTGELEYVPPNMIAILIAKWIADCISEEGVYDVAQTILGHPFMDLESSLRIVQGQDTFVEELIPPQQTMDEITVVVPSAGLVSRATLEIKLGQLRQRGLMDAGLVLVNDNDILQGYLPQDELDFGLSELGKLYADDVEVRLLGDAQDEELDMSHFVDRTPLSIPSKAPLEYAVEMFGKLGLRYLIINEDGSGKMVGVAIRKRLVAYLDQASHE